MKLNHQSSLQRVLATAVTALVGAALFTAVPLRAEDPAPGTPAAPEAQKTDRAGKKGEDRMEKRLEEMKTNLSLTDDQVSQIKTIREEQMASVKSIMDDSSLSKDDKREKAKPFKDAADEKIAAILTPEQKTKWEEAKKNRKKGQDPK